MKLFVFASSLTSSYWNGAATYYRGIYKNLSVLGHEIVFAEPDIYGRQQKRDDEDFSYAEVVVYSTPRDIPRLLARACSADLVIKHSGVGQDDDVLESGVLRCRSPQTQVAFWDVDAPATLARVTENPRDAFRRLIPEYDFIFTYGGGPPVVERYLGMGARNCRPIYNALDPDTHFRILPEPQSSCDLVLVANRLPDREQRIEEFFFRAAELAPEMRFHLGGEGWADKPLPSNVRRLGHVATREHNRINSSARMVLNVNRDSMASVGFSPPTRIFEAAGAAACVISDAWQGIENFFTPGYEILVAHSAEDIVGYLRDVAAAEAREIGNAMRAKALAKHTYSLRAAEVDAVLRRARMPAETAA